MSKATVSRTRQPKHVIFLGAGASANSGYPLADGLRSDWLASADGLRRKIDDVLSDLHVSDRKRIQEIFHQWVEPLKGSLQLFREGGFGTIDEFCYLIRDARATEVQQLKNVLRAVFGVHSPEKQFHESDYYRFIQRLFEPSLLHKLRSDIVVMSFNYDVYLEWLLRRALNTRKRALGQRPQGLDSASLKTDSLVTSGFSLPQVGVKCLNDDDGFCLLKLHGMVAWPNRGGDSEEALEPSCSFEHIFEPEIPKRLDILLSHNTRGPTPIVFPWELMKSDGTFLPESEFVMRDAQEQPYQSQTLAGGRFSTDPSLFQIFQAVWKRAREEVQVAARISFVGLSMHEYLNPGFEFLFRDRTGEIDLVVTDRNAGGAQGNTSTRSELNPIGPSARTLDLLARTCPNLMTNINAPEQIGKRRPGFAPKNAVRNRINFSDFIVNEMEPIADTK